MGSARHGRQVRLAEVGEAGQARLEAAEVVLGGAPSLARDVSAAYLSGAGVTVLVRDGEPGEDPALLAALASLGITDPSAREVALGALRAVVVMRELLGVGAVPAAGAS
ncbi:MAG: hypothetical protein JWP97_1643 [Labilithrix sp.]|nr:hypothetical protein [Labilithrix sp.]